MPNPRRIHGWELSDFTDLALIFLKLFYKIEREKKCYKAHFMNPVLHGHSSQIKTQEKKYKSQFSVEYECKYSQ